MLPSIANPVKPRAAWYPILAVSIAMVSFVCIKTGRDAVFFNQGGLFQLPIAYLWIALASLPAGMLHVTAMKRWGTRRVRTGLLIFSGWIFFTFVPFADLEHQTAMLVLFILVPVIFAAVFAGTWLLAADLLEGAGTDLTGWTYAQIGAGSMLGGMAGGLLANAVSSVLSPRFLVLTGALILFALALFTSHVHRKHPLSDLPFRSGRKEFGKDLLEEKSGQVFRTPGEISRLMREPYLYGLVGVGGLAALAGVLIDFQFYAAVTISGKTSAGFFATFYALLNLAALLVQLVVAPRLQSRLGVGGTLMVLPITLLGGALFSSFAATLARSSALKLMESGVKNSMHRFVWEQVFLPIGRRQREMAKMLVDGVSARIAEGMGAAALYVWLAEISPAGSGLPLSRISQVMILVVLAWIGLTVYLYYKGCSQIGSFDPNLRLPDS